MDALNGMLAGQASIWAQPDGPNTQPQYLGCHEMSDLEDPEGDVNLAYCPDPARSGGFRVTGSWQGAPGGPPTTTLTVPVGKTGDYLEHWPCPGNLILNKVDCGRRDQFTNRARAFALYRAYRTGRTYQNMAARSPEDEGESMLEVPFAAEDVLYLYGLSAARQSIAALGNLKAIDFLDDAQCGGDCGPARGVGQIGVAAGEPLAGSAADFAALYITQDGGGTWTAAAADPFGAGEEIAAVAVFSVGPGAPRILVARSAGGAGDYPEVAYSDDLGATWTVVEVSDVADDVVATLYLLDQYNIWAVTDDGYILKSEDGGASWFVQDAGEVAGGESLGAVAFANPRVGYVAGSNNTLAVTEDGGLSWTAVIGPAAMAAQAATVVGVFSARSVWVGYDSGNLYYTEDGGASWHERSFPGSGAGEVAALAFVHPMVGWMLFNPTVGAPRILRTIDGGYTWEPLALPTSMPANGLCAVDENTVFIAGDVEGTTGFVGKVFAA